MFKKSKSKVLVDDASEEEEDVSWHHEHARKDKDSEGTEEVLSPSTKFLVNGRIEWQEVKHEERM